MDKNTLSNYGWIVIAVLVLSVMIALATPFGEYIKAGVESTTTGLFETGEKAMNVVGMSAGDGSFESGSGTQTNTSTLNPTDVEITNNTYTCGDYIYTAVGTGNEFGAATLTEAKEVFKNQIVTDTGMSWDEFLIAEDISEGEIWEAVGLTEEYFEPFVQTGWKVSVIDKTKTEYGAILESINGKPITDMYYTFEGCASLTIAPKIPDSVTDIRHMFEGCTSLTDLSNLAIPSGVTDMYFTFAECSSLTDLSSFTIPCTVTSMFGSFRHCSALTKAPIISDGVINMDMTFGWCTALTELPTIPKSVTESRPDEIFFMCTQFGF